jgi:hypothetical protein
LIKTKTQIKEIIIILKISSICVLKKVFIYFTKLLAFSKTAAIPLAFLPFPDAKNGCPPPFPSMCFPNSRITP